VGAQGVGDDGGVSGVGFGFAGPGLGLVVGDGAGHVADGLSVLPEEGEEEGGGAGGDVDGPAGGATEFCDLVE
jgi:hypothetical protein